MMSARSRVVSALCRPAVHGAPTRAGRALADEAGAVAVIVALSITVLAALLALIVDVGYVYETRRQLQSAADAAALAGMNRKIMGATDAEVMDIAREYAGMNDFAEGSSNNDPLVVLSGAPDTVITEEYVKVGVSKRVSLFFAPVLEALPGVGGGLDDRTIKAQGKALKVYVTGARGVIPWGLTTIKPTRAVVDVAGTSTELFYDEGSDTWMGDIPVPSTGSGSGYAVDLTLYNGQDFPETFAGVHSIFVHESGDAVTDAYLDDNTLSPGESTNLYVEATADPTARMGGRNYSFAPVGGGVYRATITAPDINEGLQSFSVDVSLDKKTYSRAAVLIVKKATHPVKSFDLDRTHYPFQGGGGSTAVSLNMNDFTYGDLYDLKVISDPESGNFQALDFRYITHFDGTEEGLNSSASDYYANLSAGYPGFIHIGDIIATLTGNLSGPRTESGLDTRFADCNMTFSAWEAAGKQPGCSRLVTVPIIELIERMTGKSDGYVAALAVFFVEDYDSSGQGKSNITGRFVEYARSGTYSTDPPGTGLFIETARLDKTDY